MMMYGLGLSNPVGKYSNGVRIELQKMDQLSLKREAYRLEIRRKATSEILGARRKLFLELIAHQTQLSFGNLLSLIEEVELALNNHSGYAKTLNQLVGFLGQDFGSDLKPEQTQEIVSRSGSLFIAIFQEPNVSASQTALIGVFNLLLDCDQWGFKETKLGLMDLLIEVVRQERSKRGQFSIGEMVSVQHIYSNLLSQNGQVLQNGQIIEILWTLREHSTDQTLNKQTLSSLQTFLRDTSKLQEYKAPLFQFVSWIYRILTEDVSSSTALLALRVLNILLDSYAAEFCPEILKSITRLLSKYIKACSQSVQVAMLTSLIILVRNCSQLVTNIVGLFQHQLLDYLLVFPMKVKLWILHLYKLMVQTDPDVVLAEDRETKLVATLGKLLQVENQDILRECLEILQPVIYWKRGRQETPSMCLELSLLGVRQKLRTLSSHKNALIAALASEVGGLLDAKE